MATSISANKPMQVGLLGLGTVGLGTWSVLARNQDEILRRAGRPIRITHIAEKALERARELTRGAAVEITPDAEVVLSHPDIGIIVELIGGLEPARTLVLRAITNGKHDDDADVDRKSTRLNSSHANISYAVFCLKK